MKITIQVSKVNLKQHQKNMMTRMAEQRKQKMH